MRRACRESTPCLHLSRPPFKQNKPKQNLPRGSPNTASPPSCGASCHSAPAGACIRPPSPADPKLGPPCASGALWRVPPWCKVGSTLPRRQNADSRQILCWSWLNLTRCPSEFSSVVWGRSSALRRTNVGPCPTTRSAAIVDLERAFWRAPFFVALV